MASVFELAVDYGAIPSVVSDEASDITEQQRNDAERKLISIGSQGRSLSAGRRKAGLMKRSDEELLAEVKGLLYARPRKRDPFKLYLYGRNKLHNGGQWFRAGQLLCPDKEIPAGQARILAEAWISRRLEVRITDAMDVLMFHSQHGEVIYGSSGFWSRI